MILLLANLYKEALYMASYDVMMYLGGDPDSKKLQFAEWFGEATDDAQYTMVILFACPFICRERFWHYLITIQCAHFLK